MRRKSRGIRVGYYFACGTLLYV